MNSYGLYSQSHRVIFLPFTKSKGTQNVSRGIRLPGPQNKFHALTKESFLDAFIISILPLICFLSVKVWEKHAAGSLAKGETAHSSWSLGEDTLCSDNYQLTHSSSVLQKDVITLTVTSLDWLFFFLHYKPIVLTYYSVMTYVSTFIPSEPCGSELVKLLLPFSSTSRIWL